jgi:hypothetical protein
MTDRITAEILVDPRFAVVKASAASQSDVEVVDAIRQSGLLSDYAYSEVAAALLILSESPKRGGVAEDIHCHTDQGET